MFREPVSRLWSYCNMICEDWNTNKSPKELFDEYITKCDIYVDIFDKFKNVFDEVLCLSTEKFFGSQEQCNKLTDFLEIDRIEMTNQFSNEYDYDKFDQSDLQKYQKLLKNSCNFHKNL